MQREQEYPKQIDTLVQDIYGLFEKVHNPSEQNLDDFALAVRTILKKRLEEDPSQVRDAYLRMSSIGKPDRQLWYSMRLDKDGKQTRRVDGQTFIKFIFGDLIEALVIFLAKESGHTVENEQLEITVDGVDGHLDCTIDGVLLDVKSASTWGMKKFRDNNLAEDDPFGYVGQLSGYKKALEDKYGFKIRQGFLAFNKENAEMVFSPLVEKHTINIPERIEHLKDTLAKDTPPSRCYSAKPEDNGNVELPKGCSWCTFKEMCWNDSNGGQGLRVFKYATGPKFFTKVTAPPRVEEITNNFWKLPNTNASED